MTAQEIATRLSTTTQRAMTRAVTLPVGYVIWIAVLGLLVLQGLYSFYVQTAEGHYLSNESDLVPWGLYITGFVFFVGASAGATIIGLLIHGLGRRDYAPLGTRALLVGLFSLMSAILFIVVDVGSISRMVRLPWIWNNPTSMFTYTSLTYYAFGLLLLAELYLAQRLARGGRSKTDRIWAKWLAIIAVPFALVVLHAPHGGLFAVVKAREYWNSPLPPVHFAAIALVSGTAIMLLLAILTAWLRGRDLVSRATLDHMGRLLAFFVAFVGFLDLFDYLVTAYSDVPAGNEAWSILTTHHLPFTVLYYGGLVAALVILLFRRTVPSLAVASIVALVAVAAYRYLFVTIGVLVPLWPFIAELQYSPSAVEISVAVGIVALGLLGYSVFSKALPVEEGT